MITTFLHAFRATGIRAKMSSKAVLEVSEAGQRHVFSISERIRAPRPSEIHALESERKRLSAKGQPVLVARYISESTGLALIKQGWVWADTCGNWDIRAPGLRLQRRVVSSPPKIKESSLPAGGRGLALVRFLIHEPDQNISATDLARQAGVSQPRASQILKELVELGFVNHPTRFEWEVDRGALLEHFVTEYPGPKGNVQYFYTLKSPNEAAVDLAVAVGKKAGALVSGDVAADLLAAHRNPSHLLVYRTTPWRKIPSDWVEAAGRDDANIRVVSADDKSIGALILTREFKGTNILLADPTQVLWDLHHCGGDDRLDTAEVLKKWILNTPYAS